MTSLATIEPKSVIKHEKYLRDLRCAVSLSPFVTLHHCHGGSMKEHGWHVGMGQKQNPFLQIPLQFKYHVGHLGIDSGYGVESWEAEFGTQMEHLHWVNNQLPYDIFWMAAVWEERNRMRSITTRRSTGRDSSSIRSVSSSDTKN